MTAVYGRSTCNYNFTKTKMGTFEPSEVVAKYLALFEQDRFDFKYYFAPNSIIDWYGRTISGVNKIHYYLRSEVSRNCKHVGFLEPVSCSPFESRTTHMATKTITNKSARLSTMPDGSNPVFYAKRNFRSLNDSLNDENKWTTLASLYTPLRYVEVKGTMRMSWLTTEGLPRPGYNERPTCVRISYRVSMTDNEVQFALVIYEDIGTAFPFTNIRRNLETAFSTASEKDEGNKKTFD